MGGVSVSKIVVTGRIPEVAVEKLRAEHEVDAWSSTESMSRQELLCRVAGADALVTLLTERVDAELLDAAGPQLQVVANVAVGYDNIDVPACVERGVIATNTPGVLTEATADIAMALILMATRRTGEGERIIRSASRGSGECSTCSAVDSKARPSASWAWAGSGRRPLVGRGLSAWT